MIQPCSKRLLSGCDDRDAGKMDLTTVAVPHTLDRLRPLLPEPPARLLEVGCGRGALAVALMELGYRVTGVDRNAEMAAAAGDRGVPVVQADIRDITPGEGYDVVLFTRSLHHADDLDEILGHAASLLTPGGLLVIEEFAWERVNQAAAHFLRQSCDAGCRWTARCWGSFRGSARYLGCRSC